MNDSADLLPKMPTEARKSLEVASAAHKRFQAGTDQRGHAVSFDATVKAFDVVGIPRAKPGNRVYEPATAFDEAQRAVLLWSALEGLGVGGFFSVPGHPNTRRAWLGADPRAGLLTTLTVGDQPLWRALQLANGTPTSTRILDALPFDHALRVLEEVALTGFGIQIEHERLRLFRDLKDEGRAWATEVASSFPRAQIGTSSWLAFWAFVALARAKVPIERTWEDLYPNFTGVSSAALIECAGALPDDRRAEILERHLPSWRWAVEMVAAFPTAAMATAMLARVEPHSAQWTNGVEQLRDLGKQHPEVARAVEAIVSSTPEPVELHVSRSIRPASAAELASLEREQLRIGACGYDAKDLDAEARFATDSGNETALHGTLEIRTIVDARGNSVYDVLTYFGDAGVVFRAGTTEQVGWIAQGGVVLAEKNEVLRHALQKATGPLATPQKKKPAKRATKPGKRE